MPPKRTRKLHDPSMRARALVAWYEQQERQLSWRGSRDPYAIWVSEIMLQQTRAAAVETRYPAFLRQFPDPFALAAASDDELLKAWQGLGYYRRARQLRAAMQDVVREHGGCVPKDPAALRALPGIGPYTCGAILSIAFDRGVAAIDGNAERVITRLLGIEEDPRKKLGREHIESYILALLDHASPRDINQALMDLGALVCLPKAPRCNACPWHENCVANQEGSTDRIPKLPKRAKAKDIHTSLVSCRKGAFVLAHRIPKGEVNEGQLELPGLGLPVPKGKELASYLSKAHDLELEIDAPIGSFLHSITRYRIEVSVHRARCLRKITSASLSWEDPEDQRLPWSTATRKALSLLARFESGQSERGA